MIHFFDASALVKRFVAEEGSEEVVRLLESTLPAATRLSEAEVASALERRCREGSFPPVERDRAISALRRDFRSFLVVELTLEVIEAGLGLLARHPLRAGDALQLASCLELRRRLRHPISFVAFDDRLREAARKEGLEVEQTVAAPSE